MMETCKIENLYDLKETIAAELFEGAEYPWEVLGKIKDFIVALGNTLSEEEQRLDCTVSQSSAYGFYR